MHENHPTFGKFVKVKKNFLDFYIRRTAGKWRDETVLALQIHRKSSEAGLAGSGYFFVFIIFNFTSLFASHLLTFPSSDDNCDFKLEATRNNSAKEVEKTLQIK